MDDKQLEMLKIKVDIWKQVINTQQHFNDLEMKVRNFGILIVSALVGAAGVSIKSGYFVFGMSLSVIFFIVGALLWLCFYFVDTYWYHPLLLGSVKQGIEIEKELKKQLPNINLTETIGKNSPSEIPFFSRFTNDGKIHSTGKSKIFYFTVAALLILCAFCSFISTYGESEVIKSEQSTNIKAVKLLENLTQKVEMINSNMQQQAMQEKKETVEKIVIDSPSPSISLENAIVVEPTKLPN